MTNSNFNLLACCFGLIVPLTLQAASTMPGGVAQAPLFTATSSGGGVPSNIFFQLDDSGSMDWDILTKKYWVSCLYDPTATSCSLTSLQTDGNFNNSTTSVPGFTSENADWRVQSAAMNVLYYNPDVTYVPWQPSSTTTYSNASFTAAKDDPNSTDTPKDLTNFVFAIARDTHGYTGTKPSLTSGGTSSSKKVGTVVTTTINQGLNRSVGANGMVDFWDEHTVYQVPLTGSITQTDVTYAPTKSNTPVSTTTTGVGTNKVTVTNTYTQTLGQTRSSTSLTSGTGLNGRTLAEEQTNIANWYQYYRRRINIAKGAIGQVITANPPYRYGLNTIWNRVLVEVPSKYDPANSTTPRSDYITPNKALLASLYARGPSSGTPLPDALERVGRYFKHSPIPTPTTSNPVTSDPSAISTTTTTYTDPIVFECQQNFGILLTDGYWNSDLDETTSGSAQTTIQDADGDGIGSTSDTTSSQRHSTVADVAKYYYDTDLSALADRVPTNEVDHNNKQHMVTYTVAFGLEGNLLDRDGDSWPDYNSKTNLPGSWTEASNWGDPSGGSDIPEKIDDLWHAAYNAKGLYISATSPEKMSEGFAQILENISKRDYKGSAASASFNTSTLSGSNSAYLSQFSLINNIWSGDLLAYNLSSTGVILNADGSTPTDSATITPKWKAGTQLDTLSNPVTARHIFTYNRSATTGLGTTGAKGVPFQWTDLTNYLSSAPTVPVVSEAQKDLGTSTSGAVAAVTVTSSDAVNATALARMAYLRGDTSNDGTGVYGFRKRAFVDISGATHKNLLGDIVHSEPIFVSAPQGNWPAKSPFLAGTTTYKTFKNANASRTPIVYVGANDGMLHAFNANNGSEAMAYIPQTLFSSSSSSTGLHYLTNPSYTHRYYVDMSPVVEDVVITRPSGSPAWRTVLVGGFMGGERGIFALDVTNPSLFLTENATNAAQIGLWEFNSDDDADMGYSFSIPSIGMMPNGKWAAIFGNGYNSTNGTGNLGSTGKEKDVQGNYSAGRASLFIVFLDGGLDGTWTYGTDYIKITAPDSTDPTVTAAINTSIDCSSASCNGLSSPQVVDTNLDRKIDRVYAGDLKGNMWAFNLSSTNPSNWKVAYGTTSSPTPLFTSTYHKSANVLTPLNNAGKSPVQQNTTRQPITSRPVLLRNLKAHGYPNLLVLFGTGQYVTLADTSSTTMQGFYGVWDHGTGGLTPANLIQQGYLDSTFTVGTTTTTVAANSIRVLTKNAIVYDSSNTTTNQGWFINLAKDAANPTVSIGERQIVDSDILDSKYLFFNTWIPGEKTTVAPTSCSTQGNTSGSGYLMSVDVYTGGEADKALFDLSGNSVVDAGDKAKDSTNTFHSVGGRIYSTGLPGSSSFIQGIQYTPGTDAGTDLSGKSVIEVVGDSFRRRSWQELRKD